MTAKTKTVVSRSHELDTSRFNVLRSHLFYHVLIFLTLVVFFVGIPLFMLTPEEAKQNLELFKNKDVLLAMILVLAGLFLVLSLLYWTLSAFSKIRLGKIFVVFLFSWVALSGLLFPLTHADGMFSLTDSPTNWANLVCTAAASVFTTLLLVSRHSAIGSIFFSVLIGSALVGKISPLASELQSKISYEAVQLSDKKNIIVVSLDGLPGHMTKRVIESDSIFSSEFKDFTFFSNAVSSSPATEASLMGVVLGNADYSKIEKIDKKQIEEIYFNDETDFNLYTNASYSPYNLTGTEVAAFEQLVMPRLQRIAKLYENVVLRSFTKFGIQKFRRLENFLKAKPSARPRNSTIFFDQIINNFETGSEHTGVIYMHFPFTHFPNTLDENCSYRGDDREWDSKNQNANGVRNTTVCGVKKFLQLLDKLKEIGVYDQSLIILNSDHGKPANYYTDSPNNLRINNNPHWGFDRYRPTLMIKVPNAQRGVMGNDERLVLLDDLAVTTCVFVKSKSDCQNISGMDLLSESPSSQDKFFMLIVKDENSTFERSTHKPIELSRAIPLEQSMRNHQEVVFSEHSTVSRPLRGGWEIDSRYGSKPNISDRIR